MSTTNSTHENGTDAMTEAAWPPARGTDAWYRALNSHHTPLGVDSEGMNHHVDEHAKLVYVIDEDGTLDHVQDLTVKSFPSLHDAARDWADYVDHERGWETMWVTFYNFDGLLGGDLR